MTSALQFQKTKKKHLWIIHNTGKEKCTNRILVKYIGFSNINQNNFFAYWRMPGFIDLALRKFEKNIYLTTRNRKKRRLLKSLRFSFALQAKDYLLFLQAFLQAHAFLAGAFTALQALRGSPA